MFLRHKIRRKDGKEHRAWSVVETRRVHNGRVVQRQVLYLGEINDSQRANWSRAIEAFDEGGRSTQIALFPEDRVAPALDCDVVSIRLSEMRLKFRGRDKHSPISSLSAYAAAIVCPRSSSGHAMTLKPLILARRRQSWHVRCEGRMRDEIPRFD